MTIDPLAIMGFLMPPFKPDTFLSLISHKGCLFLQMDWRVKPAVPALKLQ